MSEVLTATRVLPGAATWSTVLRRGWALELEDLEGGANVALLLLDAHRPTERLNVPDSLKAQHVARVATGVALHSDMGCALASIVEDTCGWHDPLCGHGAEARRELILELAKQGLGPRDLAATVNLFSKVAVDADGAMTFCAGHSLAGARVVVRADADVLVALNTAPHPLDREAWSPKPIGVVVREVGVAGPDDPVRTACPENERAFAASDARQEHVR